uniref:Centrosomal protein of 72 kDa n=1 Tax=Biomphalaria glabrata TaxID=6526 RepID=A0A2C9JPD1_BIOGL
MALTLTESLIRSRVNLTHENLEDIKSLSLPGTFHEKVVSIGTSLRKFSRLKSVDFSRNALDSLQGLEHLQLLEKLNLYYNNVSSLEELQRLKHNQNLKEIDLRLNPVTRNEPDYRLYLIHMLPNLQKLDDRGVSDRERQAALTHFSSCQASEMGLESAKRQAVPKQSLPRTELMSKLLKVTTALVDDDTAIIDIMNRNEGDFGRSRPLTGSVAKEDTAVDYNLESLKALDQAKQMRYKERMTGDMETNTRLIESEKVDPRLIRYKEMYPNILAAPAESIQRIGEGHSSKDNNLMFGDEVEANMKYKGQGYFTPHPDGKYELDKFNEQASGQCKEERRSRIDYLSQDDYIRQNKPRHQRAHSFPGLEFMNDPDQAKERNLLFSLLNLVDRYWNGTKSLHKHPKFIEQSLQFISEYTLTQANKDDEVKVLRQKVEKLSEENAMLKRMKESQLDVDANVLLKRAKEDMERMHDEIRHYMNENRELQRRLDCWESGANPSQHAGGAGASDSTLVNLSVLDSLQRKNNSLAKEVEQMKTKLNQCDELTNMLQESHRSLIETNNHLLKELETSKHKHQKEIEQMHWSYEQLKTTMSQTSMIQPSPRNDLGTNNTSSYSKNKNDLLIV